MTELSEVSARNSAFYRTPRLLPGQVAKCFNVERAFLNASAHSHVFRHLSIIRLILLQPTITSADAEILVSEAELLAGVLLQDLQTPCSTGKMSNLVARLGRTYVFMDALLAIHEVVGPALGLETWWQRLADAVTAPEFFKTDKPSREEASIVKRTASRLNASLQVLKEGKRLSPVETVNIKRELLFGSLVVSEFKRARWQPWRDDDRKSRNAAAAVP